MIFLEIDIKGIKTNYGKCIKRSQVLLESKNNKISTKKKRVQLGISATLIGSEASSPT